MFSTVNYNSAWKNCNFVSSLLPNSRHECGKLYLCSVYLQGIVCSCSEQCNIFPFFFTPISPSWCDGPRNIKTPFLLQKKREQGNSRLMWRKQHFGKNSFNNSCRICLRNYTTMREIKWGRKLLLQLEVLSSMLHFVTQWESTAGACCFDE